MDVLRTSENTSVCIGIHMFPGSPSETLVKDGGAMLAL